MSKRLFALALCVIIGLSLRLSLHECRGLGFGQWDDVRLYQRAFWGG